MMPRTAEHQAHVLDAERVPRHRFARSVLRTGGRTMRLASENDGTTLAVGHVFGRRPESGPAAELHPVDVTVTPSAGARAGAALVELAAFGDSAMAGIGVDQLTDVLAVQVAQRVADATGAPVHVVGYARSGARTLDVLTAQVRAVRRAPDVAVLVVGTNDVIHATPPLALAHTWEVLLDAFEAMDTPVVMSNLPEFRAMRMLPRPLMAAARGYGSVVGAVQSHAVAQRPHVSLVDVSGAVGQEFVDDPAKMSADFFHPSAAGYARIADALTPALLACLTHRGAAGGVGRRAQSRPPIPRPGADPRGAAGADGTTGLGRPTDKPCCRPGLDAEEDIESVTTAVSALRRVHDRAAQVEKGPADDAEAHMTDGAAPC